MLPDSDGDPASVTQHLISLGVTFTIAPDLFAPVSSVRSRLRVVVRTAVPEAAIQEDSDLQLAEDQVSGSADLGEWSDGDAVPHTSRVDGSAQRQLRLRVSAAVGSHAGAHSGAGSPGLLIAFHRSTLRGGRVALSVAANTVSDIRGVRCERPLPLRFYGNATLPSRRIGSGHHGKSVVAYDRRRDRCAD